MRPCLQCICKQGQTQSCVATTLGCCGSQHDRLSQRHAGGLLWMVGAGCSAQSAGSGGRSDTSTVRRIRGAAPKSTGQGAALETKACRQGSKHVGIICDLGWPGAGHASAKGGGMERHRADSSERVSRRVGTGRLSKGARLGSATPGFDGACVPCVLGVNLLPDVPPT